MKVRIVNSGKYSNYPLMNGKLTATFFREGDEVELPDHYAMDLIKAGVVAEVTPPAEGGAKIIVPPVAKSIRSRRVKHGKSTKQT